MIACEASVCVRLYGCIWSCYCCCCCCLVSFTLFCRVLCMCVNTSLLFAIRDLTQIRNLSNSVCFLSFSRSQFRDRCEASIFFLCCFGNSLPQQQHTHINLFRSKLVHVLSFVIFVNRKMRNEKILTEFSPNANFIKSYSIRLNALIDSPPKIYMDDVYEIHFEEIILIESHLLTNCYLSHVQKKKKKENQNTTHGFTFIFVDSFVD